MISAIAINEKLNRQQRFDPHLAGPQGEGQFLYMTMYFSTLAAEAVPELR